MKNTQRIFLVLFLAFAGTMVSCGSDDKSGSAATGEKTKLKWHHSVQDLGKIKLGTTHEFDFEFENTGNKPLVVEDARGTCGCTVPDWPKDPIAPGEKGKIHVKFSPRSTGQVEKQVYVLANTDPYHHTLKIRANVSK